MGNEHLRVQIKSLSSSTWGHSALRATLLEGPSRFGTDGCRAAAHPSRRAAWALLTGEHGFESYPHPKTTVCTYRTLTNSSPMATVRHATRAMSTMRGKQAQFPSTQTKSSLS
ncbi:hypothetical protein MHYP_G00131950 [Metynnis hypsauchen]